MHSPRLAVIAVLIALSSELLGLSRTVGGDTVGTLYFRVECYHHPSRLDRWGNRCDLTSDCDPEFTFCFSKVDPTSSKCGLKRFQYSFRNKNYLGVCAKYEPVNFPRVVQFDLAIDTSKLFLTVTIMEAKQLLPNQLIDEIVFKVLPGLPVLPSTQEFSEAAMAPLNISHRIVNKPDKPRVDLRAALRCAQHRYGPLCTVECQPSDRYDCRQDGSRKCRPGWTGPDCAVRDYCQQQPPPCRPWAKCHNRADSFACECDGYFGPQCETKGDPCFNHRCVNGATCIAAEGRPSCNCDKGWIGRRCEWRDPCVLVPCGDRGNCSSHVDANATSTTDNRSANFTCVCNQGFAGLLCDNKTTAETTTTQPQFSTSGPLTTPSSSAMMGGSSASITIIILLSLIVAGCFTAGVFLFFRRYRKRRQKLIISQRREPIYRVAHHVQSSVYDDPESLYEDPDMNNPLYLYEEPDEPYYGEEQEPAESQPEERPEPTPNLPERVVSTSSSKEPRSPIRFVRASAQS